MKKAKDQKSNWSGFTILFQGRRGVEMPSMKSDTKYFIYFSQQIVSLK
jgi:hypothetical protein